MIVIFWGDKQYRFDSPEEARKAGFQVPAETPAPETHANQTEQDPGGD
jgi:hypothetical protein